jgi:hypothetical protein
MPRPLATRVAGLLVLPALPALLLAGCATDERIPTRSALTPAEARALIVQAIPPAVPDRAGWATDVHAALTAMQIAVTVPNVCAVVAVTEQESSFRANPAVPGMAAIAWREIDAKADRAGVPKLVVRTALQIDSPTGKSYAERIDAATTERDLSEIFEDLIGIVPMGRTLFAGLNPIRTAGPMQVSIAYAEKHATQRPYPYPVKTNLRGEVFTRRGGLYFGIAHLLDYPAPYDRPVYRFADFNAGHYASRNAAFQNAVAIASGVPLALDGDLVDPGAEGGRRVGSTEQATRVLGPRIGLSDAAIRSALEQEKQPGLERSTLWQRVFQLADQANGAAVPRAVLPRIQLKSPKITRNLTTEWFAGRVDERYQRCATRASAPSS